MKMDCRNRAFTLVELIVVMSMLTAVFALSIPSLSRFFRGRTVDEEAKRFLGLIHYAQSEAVSQGIPMKIQLDLTTGLFSLDAQEGYEWLDHEPVAFLLENRIRFEIDKRQKTTGLRPSITVLPDGTFDETSLQEVIIQEETEPPVSIIRTEFMQRYEIISQATLAQAQYR